mmetsp:Transcript_49844/g.92007  ORF Transcript_49844/g.92007 Transcript_49844/m.92007 type:complete len:220 (+) Transcript_49844:1097-1756(+)
MFSSRNAVTKMKTTNRTPKNGLSLPSTLIKCDGVSKRMPCTSNVFMADGTFGKYSPPMPMSLAKAVKYTAFAYTKMARRKTTARTALRAREIPRRSTASSGIKRKIVNVRAIRVKRRNRNIRNGPWLPSFSSCPANTGMIHASIALITTIMLSNTSHLSVQRKYRFFKENHLGMSSNMNKTQKRLSTDHIQWPRVRSSWAMSSSNDTHSVFANTSKKEM